MSLETAIAALTQQAGLLLDLPQQIATLAQQQIASVTATYNARLATLTVNVEVNAATGIDTNPGTAALPVRTLEKAVSMVPVGGVGNIYLQGDITLAADVPISNKRITVKSSGSRRAINFTKETFVLGASTYRSIKGFRLINGASLSLNFVRINIPDATGDANLAHALACPIGVGFGESSGFPAVTLSDVELNIPANPWTNLLGLGQSTSQAPLALFVYGVTLPGAITSYNGRLIMDFTAGAGTATSGIRWLLTNIATV